ncbi:MAG: hypothetical protein AAFO07_12925 [Bacteroidota bacterium]
MQASNNFILLIYKIPSITILVSFFLCGCSKNLQYEKQAANGSDIDTLVGILIEHTGLTDKFIVPLVFSLDSTTYKKRIINEVLYVNSPGIPSYDHVKCNISFLEKITVLILNNQNDNKGSELIFGSIRVLLVYQHQVQQIRILNIDQSKKVINSIVQAIKDSGYFTSDDIAYCEMMYCHLNKTGWPCKDL